MQRAEIIMIGLIASTKIVSESGAKGLPHDEIEASRHLSGTWKHTLCECFDSLFVPWCGLSLKAVEF